MRTLSAFASVAALVALSACAGAGASHSALPGAPRTMSGSTVAYNDSEVFVAASDALRAYPANVSGTSPTPDVVYPYPAGTKAVDTVEAPDGTVYVLLVSTDPNAKTAWVAAYAPHSTTIEQQFALTALSPNLPFALGLVGDGIVVATQQAIVTYPYGAGNNASPIRSIQLGGGASAFSVDTDDRLYVGLNGQGGSDVEEFSPDANGYATPIATYRAPAFLRGLIVAQDGTVYGTFDNSALANGSYVQTIPTNGGTPRLVAQYGATGLSGYVRALGVDSDGYLYVGVGPNPTEMSEGVQDWSRLDVFGSNAVVTNGTNPTPSRQATSVAPATGPTVITGLAVGV